MNPCRLPTAAVHGTLQQHEWSAWGCVKHPRRLAGLAATGGGRVSGKQVPRLGRFAKALSGCLPRSGRGEENRTVRCYVLSYLLPTHVQSCWSGAIVAVCCSTTTSWMLALPASTSERPHQRRRLAHEPLSGAVS